MEQVFGLPGLALLGVSRRADAVRARLGPRRVAGARTRRSRRARTSFTYAYFGIALFGAAMTPYEVFFFSSRRGRGALDASRTSALNRANVYIGFPLGGVLSLSIMALAALVLAPLHIGVDTLPQVALPVGADARASSAWPA